MTPVTLIYDPHARVRPDAEVTHLQDEERVLRRMIEEFDTFGRAIVGWSCESIKGIHPGPPCEMVQRGDPHGCFARGEIVSDLLIDVDGRPIVVAMFWKITDPSRAKFL